VYCSTDCLSRCGAAVKNLAHSASFHSMKNNAPSNAGTKHLDYNAYFECFAVKGRNLVDFFTGRRRDRTNFDAQDFYPEFIAPTRQNLQSIINNLDGHVTHSSKRRASRNEDKIQLSDCVKLAEWIEAALKLFLDGMPEHNIKHWNHIKANCVDTTLMLTISGGPTASSADPLIVGGPTLPGGPIRPTR